MKHFGGKVEGEGEVGLKWKTHPCYEVLCWATSAAPAIAHVKAELHWHTDLPETSHLSDRNFPFTQLRWHWPWDQGKWPNSTGKPSAHWKQQGKSQSGQECRTSGRVCGGEHSLKPRRPPELRGSPGEMWREQSCSSCGFCSLDSISTEVHLKPGIVTTSSVPSSY